MIKLLFVLFMALFVACVLFLVVFLVAGLYSASKLRKKINNDTWKEIEEAMFPGKGQSYLEGERTLSDKHRQMIKDVHESIYGENWYCPDPISPKQMDVYMFYDIKEKLDWL